MAEDLLQRGETAAALDPLTRKDVSQLVDLETVSASRPPNRSCDRAGRLPRVVRQATNPAVHLAQRIGRGWHPLIAATMQLVLSEETTETA